MEDSYIHERFPYNQFSNTILSMEPSATMASTQKIKKLRDQGKDIITLTLGEPDFDTPRHIVDAAIDALNEGFTHYAPAAGIPELREAIADRAYRWNAIPCEARNVIVSPTKTLIFQALASFVNPDDDVLVPDPAWVSYEPMIRFMRGTPVPVQCSAEDDFRMTPEAVEKAITPKTTAILLNSPSNPTGGVNLREDNEGIAELAKKHDLAVISDEIYEEIVYVGEHHSIASVDGMFERTVTISGFSKAYAMTGWRLGWLVAPQPIFDQIIKLQQHTVTCATVFAQKGGVAALCGPREPIQAMMDKFRKRRILIVKRLNEIHGMECNMPHGAFYAFPYYHFDMSTTEFCDLLLTKAGVGVTPGDAFGYSGRNHVRFSYAASEEIINRAMDNVEDALSDLCL